MNSLKGGNRPIQWPSHIVIIKLRLYCIKRSIVSRFYIRKYLSHCWIIYGNVQSRSHSLRAFVANTPNLACVKIEGSASAFEWFFSVHTPTNAELYIDVNEPYTFTNLLIYILLSFTHYKMHNFDMTRIWKMKYNKTWNLRPYCGRKPEL